MAHIEIVFGNSSQEINEILVARLADVEYEGFQEDEGVLKAYIVRTLFNKDNLDKLSADLGVNYIINQIEDTNWNRLWESNFQPVSVGDFCAVRADFHELHTNVLHEIVITPKMSFGTGHHPTTYMMIEQMQDIDLKNKSVLDFGTGTGVLAILAKKMGAESVLAIDNDDWSITNAEENIRNNNVDIELKKADNANGSQNFDIILANITRNVILENFSSFVSSLAKDGRLLLSGLLQSDEEHITSVATDNGLKLIKKLERNNWISLSYQFTFDTVKKK
jgi:ribosomal protein L11 methyltransferase